jgi:hypothetical protein
MDDMLEITTLGGPKVSRDGEPVTGFQSDKVRAQKSSNSAVTNLGSDVSCAIYLLFPTWYQIMCLTICSTLTAGHCARKAASHDEKPRIVPFLGSSAHRTCVQAHNL